LNQKSFTTEILQKIDWQVCDTVMVMLSEKNAGPAIISFTRRLLARPFSISGEPYCTVYRPGVCNPWPSSLSIVAHQRV